ncbi:MAG: hypothetical protein MOB07_31415 [Acidobacteria bacterium]|nr:hypothetical protein [Acidobacteriota bacterium]
MKHGDQIKPGDLIRDCYGQEHTALEVLGTSIRTTRGVWIHITKAFKARPAPQQPRNNFAERENNC